MANDNRRKVKQNQMCIRDSSRAVVFGEDRIRKRGNLPATFYVLTRVIFSMAKDVYKRQDIFIIKFFQVSCLLWAETD